MPLHTVSIPLRYRIAQLGLCVGGADPVASIRRPEVVDHPRTRDCVRLLQGGVQALPLHGYDSLESVIKVFCEHGIAREDPWFRSTVERMLELDESDPQLYRGIGKPGRILDEHRCGGSRMIRAASLARAGLENEALIEAEVAESVDVLASMAGLREQSDVVLPHGDVFVIREGIGLPSYYHLQVLAFTHGWRTSENLARVRDGVDALCAVPLPDAYVKEGSQIVAPASLRAGAWSRPWELEKDFDRACWIDRVLLLLKAGLVSPKFAAAVAEYVLTLPERWAKEIRASAPFLRWGAYTGVGLEPDWRSPRRKYADLWFRRNEIEKLLGAPTEELRDDPGSARRRPSSRG
jgi:hypothetical protein